MIKPIYTDVTDIGCVCGIIETSVKTLPGTNCRRKKVKVKSSPH